MESLDAELPEPNQLDNRLRTTLNIQFLHNIGDVIAHGFLADKQLLCYVLRRLVLHKQLKHFTLTICQYFVLMVVTLHQYCHPSLPGLLYVTRFRDTVRDIV